MANDLVIVLNDQAVVENTEEVVTSEVTENVEIQEENNKEPTE